MTSMEERMELERSRERQFIENHRENKIRHHFNYQRILDKYAALEEQGIEIDARTWQAHAPSSMTAGQLKKQTQKYEQFSEQFTFAPLAAKDNDAKLLDNIQPLIKKCQKLDKKYEEYRKLILPSMELELDFSRVRGPDMLEYNIDRIEKEFVNTPMSKRRSRQNMMAIQNYEEDYDSYTPNIPRMQQRRLQAIEYRPCSDQENESEDDYGEEFEDASEVEEDLTQIDIDIPSGHRQFVSNSPENGGSSGEDGDCSLGTIRAPEIPVNKVRKTKRQSKSTEKQKVVKKTMPDPKAQSTRKRSAGLTKETVAANTSSNANKENTPATKQCIDKKLTPDQNILVIRRRSTRLSKESSSKHSTPKISDDIDRLFAESMEKEVDSSIEKTTRKKNDSNPKKYRTRKASSKVGNRRNRKRKKKDSNVERPESVSKEPQSSMEDKEGDVDTTEDVDRPITITMEYYDEDDDDYENYDEEEEEIEAMSKKNMEKTAEMAVTTEPGDEHMEQECSSGVSESSAIENPVRSNVELNNKPVSVCSGPTAPKVQPNKPSENIPTDDCLIDDEIASLLSQSISVVVERARLSEEAATSLQEKDEEQIASVDIKSGVGPISRKRKASSKCSVHSGIKSPGTLEPPKYPQPKKMRYRGFQGAKPTSIPCKSHSLTEEDVTDSSILEEGEEALTGFWFMSANTAIPEDTNAKQATCFGVPVEKIKKASENISMIDLWAEEAKSGTGIYVPFGGVAVDYVHLEERRTFAAARRRGAFMKQGFMN